MMKFIINDGKVKMIRANQAIAQCCYIASLEVSKRAKMEGPSKGSGSTNIMMVDLDAREQSEGQRPKLEGELEEVQIGDSLEKTTRISKSLSIFVKLELATLLRENSDVFSWNVVDMLGIDPKFMCH